MPGQDKSWWRCAVTLTLMFLPQRRICSFLQYVRVSSDTPPRVIYHLMTQHWGLDAPNLLISVTGGAKNFIMKPRLKNIFRQGLVKVAQTTGKKRRGFPCNCGEGGGICSFHAQWVGLLRRGRAGPGGLCVSGWTITSSSCSLTANRLQGAGLKDAAQNVTPVLPGLGVVGREDISWGVELL